MPKAIAKPVTDEVAGRPGGGRTRAAQRESTRLRLVEAAIEVFAINGYAKARVEEIADLAGTTRATFYLHFTTKSDLLADIWSRAEAHFRPVYAALAPIAQAPNRRAVRAWLEWTMQEWSAVADCARPLQEAAMIEPAVRAEEHRREDRTVNDLAVALRAGAPALGEADAAIYASVLLASLQHHFARYLRGHEFDRDRVLDVMTESWMAVITRARRDSR